MTIGPTFDRTQLSAVNDAVSMAEDRIFDFYRLSGNEWRRNKYDVNTLADLSPGEIADGKYAQIVLYRGRLRNTELSTNAYDFYKICLQDHTILSAADRNGLSLFPLSLFIVVHELVHIVRFVRFLHNFEATVREKMEEEIRVHGETRAILQNLPVPGLAAVFDFFGDWELPLENLCTSGEKGGIPS